MVNYITSATPPIPSWKRMSRGSISPPPPAPNLRNPRNPSHPTQATTQVTLYTKSYLSPHSPPLSLHLAHVHVRISPGTTGPHLLLSVRSPTLGTQVAQTHHSPWDLLEVNNFSGNSSPWFAWNIILVCELSCVLPTSLPTIGFHKCKTFQLLAHLISHPVVHPTRLFQSRHGGKAGFCEKAINSYSFAIPEMKAHSFEVLREAASSSSKNMKSVSWFHWFFIVSATPGWRTWTVGASSRPRCSEWTTKLRQLAGANF